MTAFLAQIDRLNPIAQRHRRASSTTRRAWRWPTPPIASWRAGGRWVRCTACRSRSRISRRRSAFRCTKGSPIFKDVDAGRGLGDRRAAAARRHDSDRQDQRARVRHGLAHLQQGLRHDRQSVRSHQERRRLERRRGRGACRRACCRSPTAATSAARSAIPPTSTTSSRCGPRVGLVPIAPTPLPMVGVSVKGPMARSVADVAFMLSVMAGADGRDPQTYPSDPAVVRRGRSIATGGRARGVVARTWVACRSIAASAPCSKRSARPSRTSAASSKRRRPT